MSRDVPWIAKADDQTTATISLAGHSGFLVLQHVGPLSFVLGDQSGKKFKTSLGNVNTCSCQKRYGDYCIHIAFVLSKVFRLPPTNPLCWQRGFIDRELQQILRGSVRNQVQSSTTDSRSSAVTSQGKSAHPAEVEQRPLGPDSICAICQEEMNVKQGLAYCRYASALGSAQQVCWDAGDMSVLSGGMGRD